MTSSHWGLLSWCPFCPACSSALRQGFSSASPPTPACIPYTFLSWALLRPAGFHVSLIPRTPTHIPQAIRSLPASADLKISLDSNPRTPSPDTHTPAGPVPLTLPAVAGPRLLETSQHCSRSVPFWPWWSVPTSCRFPPRGVSNVFTSLHLWTVTLVQALTICFFSYCDHLLTVLSSLSRAYDNPWTTHKPGCSHSPVP